MARAITFPKTSADTWTNRQTGTEIHRDNGEYTVHVPVLSTVGHMLVSPIFTNLAPARAWAKSYVTKNVLPVIAKAHSEALTANEQLDTEQIEQFRRWALASLEKLGQGHSHADAIEADWDEALKIENRRADAVEHYLGRAKDLADRRRFIARIRDYRTAHPGAGLRESRDAIVVEDESQAYVEHYFRLYGDIVNRQGKIFPPAASDLAGEGRYVEAVQSIYSWRAPQGSALEGVPS